MPIINANKINIHSSVKIANDVVITCDEITIGKNSVIRSGCIINCKTFTTGDNLYMCDNVEIGRGGCYGANSNVTIGNNVGIFERTIINPSESVEIGNDVGIGGEVMIWTHGAWLDVTQGFPSDFGPVKIGDRVWLPARCIVLPNVTIGDDSVIGIGSTINRDIPSGCLAAGSPCKVIKENCYPKELNNEELERKCLDIINNWCKLHRDKGIVNIQVNYEDGALILKQYVPGLDDDSQFPITKYDVKKKEITGYTNDVSEDLRDYLRREGIKIYTDEPFLSIKPMWLTLEER